MHTPTGQSLVDIEYSQALFADVQSNALRYRYVNPDTGELAPQNEIRGELIALLGVVALPSAKIATFFTNETDDPLKTAGLLLTASERVDILAGAASGIQNTLRKELEPELKRPQLLGGIALHEQGGESKSQLFYNWTVSSELNNAMQRINCSGGKCLPGAKVSKGTPIPERLSIESLRTQKIGAIASHIKHIPKDAMAQAVLDLAIASVAHQLPTGMELREYLGVELALVDEPASVDVAAESIAA